MKAVFYDITLMLPKVFRKCNILSKNKSELNLNNKRNAGKVNRSLSAITQISVIQNSHNLHSKLRNAPAQL